MNSLSIANAIATGPRTIQITFSQAVSSAITVANFTLFAKKETITQPTILSLSIYDNTITLTTTPLYPLTQYTLTCFSSTIKFVSADNTSILISEQVVVVAPLSTQDSSIKKSIKNLYNNNLYDLNNGLTGDHVNNISAQLSKTLYDLRQTKNEIFLSKVITDEYKIRGEGPSDRLNEESAYEILRVATNPTDQKYSFTLGVSNFDARWVSLQQASFSETLSPTNSLVFTLQKEILAATSITVFTNQNITYDIGKYGYYILNNQYDPNSSIYYLLAANQIQLNETFFIDNEIAISSIVSISFQYNYKNVNIFPYPGSLAVYSIRSVTRELLESLVNIVDLAHNTITDAYGNAASIAALTFASSLNPNQPHNAFLVEVPFNNNALPSLPGQYSVDYTNGRIYVYGAVTNDGTGPYPPVVSYFYKYTYTQDIDYTVDDNQNLISIPFGNLRNNSATITHQYDFILQNGVDYLSNPHTESLNESIGNGLLSINTLKTQNYPITNVFRIYNLTSGEIYTPIYWNYNRIYFAYKTAPAVLSVTNESARFVSITDETMIGTQLTPNIIKIQLQNTHIASRTEDLIGSSYNSSLSFSEETVFANELFFDTYAHTFALPYLSITSAGQYVVDYVNGTVYVYGTLPVDLGSATYKITTIQTQNSHIQSVNNIYYDALESIDYDYFTDNTVVLSDNIQSSSELSYADTQIVSYDAPYVYSLVSIANGYNIGYVSPITNTILLGLRRQIKNLRSFYLLDDLLNNPTPYNFAPQCVYSSNMLTVLFQTQMQYATLQFDGTHFFVNLPITVSAPVILTVTNVVDLSPSPQTLTYSISGNKILISGTSLSIGMLVNILYTVSFAETNIPVLDYTGGTFAIDYNYIADEIQVSYEYGENEVDFTPSNLAQGSSYYVSYKVGALRDTLYSNFGSTVNIDAIQNFDLNFDREKYRSCLFAALGAYSTGPTVSTLKDIAYQVTKITPELEENFYQSWSLGYTHLSREDVKTTGTLTLTPAIYGNGVLMTNQTASLPASSNIPTSGTFMSKWINDWDGLDNTDTLSFTISGANVYIGANAAYMPGSTFVVSKTDLIIGTPPTLNPGVYVYYDKISTDDTVPYAYTSETYRWFVVNTSGNSVNVSVRTNNSFYAPTFIDSTALHSKDFVPIVDTFRSTKTTISITKTNFAFSFLSDNKKYLLDIGQEKHDRISLYKDVSGYMYFRVLDSYGNPWSLSAPISDWKKGESHFVAASWKLDSITREDEMHLFIDGYEVPNYTTSFVYGNTVFDKFSDYSLNNQIVGNSGSVTVSGTDMVSNNSMTVTTAINLTGINIGDTVTINESWATSTYTIDLIAGNAITLNAVIPYSLTNISFTINAQTLSCNQAIFAYKKVSVHKASLLADTTGSFNVSTPNLIVTAAALPSNTSIVQCIFSGIIRFYRVLSISGNHVYVNATVNNATVSIADLKAYALEVELPGVEASTPFYSLGDYTVNLLNGVSTHDLILLKSYGLNNQRISGVNTITASDVYHMMKSRYVSPINMKYVAIRGILYPQNTVLPTTPGVTISGTSFTYTFTIPYCPNHVLVNIYGSNIDYSTPVNITFGSGAGITLPGGAVLEFTSGNTFLSTFDIDIAPPVSAFVFYTNGGYVQDVNPSTFVTISGKIFNPSLSLFTLEMKDFSGITDPSNLTNYASLNYYYQVDSGVIASGNKLDHFVSQNAVGGKIKVNGTVYYINAIDNTSKTITTTPTMPSVVGQPYTIYNYSSLAGFANGLFLLQDPNKIDSYKYLTAGQYEVTYLSNLHIPMNLTNARMYVGSDIFGQNQINGILDSVKISNVLYDDTRVGESSGAFSITAEYNKRYKFASDFNSMVVIDFGKIPLTNNTDYYDKQIQNQDLSIKTSSAVINSNFDTAFYFDSPVVIANEGIFSKQSGNIEMWICPESEYFNDPSDKYFLDIADTASITIESSTFNLVTLPMAVGKVLSVVYGKKDYFPGGSVEGLLLKLGSNLPKNNLAVTVTYIPVGSLGNRVSLYRSFDGNIVAKLTSKTNTISTDDVLVTTISVPMVWTRGTWHKIKFDYDFNQNMLFLFVDGYLYGTIQQNIVSNGVSTSIYSANVNASVQQLPIYKIILEDELSNMYLGSDFMENNVCYASMDNIKISDQIEPIFQYYGEILDPSYTSNVANVLPSQEDAYTTLRICSDNIVYTLFNDFAICKSLNNGNFDFSMIIGDTYNIVSNDKVARSAMEGIIAAIKPANSRVFISYVK